MKLYRIILILIISMIPFSSDGHKYKGNIELMMNPAKSNLEITTSHGCLFNNALYLGIGAGLSAYMHSVEPVDLDVSMYVPIYMKTLYYCNSYESVKPFLGLESGYYVSGNECLEFVSPQLGVEFKRLSVLMKCDFFRIGNSLRVGIGINF